MATMVDRPAPALTDDILVRCHERAPRYDQENAFFKEDFSELRDAAYLLLPVPTELGGRGMTPADVAREQRRLAYYAAPTALAVNMQLRRAGVSRGEDANRVACHGHSRSPR